MKNENFLFTKDTFAICISPIICLVCPQGFVNLFLNFFWILLVVPREIEDNAYAKFLRAHKGHYGRCTDIIVHYLV